MRIQVVFIVEEDDAEWMSRLRGHSITISDVDKIKVSTPMDIGYPRPAGLQCSGCTPEWCGWPCCAAGYVYG